MSHPVSIISSIAIISTFVSGCSCIIPKYVWKDAPQGANITHVVVASEKPSLLADFHSRFTSTNAFKEKCKKIEPSKRPAPSHDKEVPAEPLFYSCKDATQETYQDFANVFAKVAPEDPPISLNALLSCTSTSCAPATCGGLYACFKIKPVCWKC